MPKSFHIRDCMHKNPPKIRAQATIDEAVQIILQSKITGLTVVDDENRVVGVISELDCLKAAVGNVYNDGNSSAVQVKDCMTVDVDSCSPDDDILSIAESMLKRNQRRRPVVQNGKLVGQISCRNILTATMSYTRGA